MSKNLTLPAELTTRLQAVAKRVRLLRVIRGLSLLVLVMSLTAGAAILADHLLELPALVRQIVFSLWMSLGSLLGMLALLVPLSRKLDPADLAAVIEKKYPELAERLSSSVELTGQGEQAARFLPPHRPADPRDREADPQSRLPARHLAEPGSRPGHRCSPRPYLGAGTPGGGGGRGALPGPALLPALDQRR